MSSDRRTARVGARLRRPGAVDLALAAGLAAVVAPASIGLVLDDGTGSRWTPVLVAGVVVLHGAVALRRRAPVAVFAVLAVAELVLALAPPLLGTEATAYSPVLLPSSLAYLVGAYTVSAEAERPWPALSLVVGVVGALVATTRFVAARRVGTVPPAVGELLFLVGALLAAVVAAWALGRFRRARAEQLAALAERARAAEAGREQRDRQVAADERTRIAREMHDVVAHSLSVMVRLAEGGRYVAERDPAVAARALGTIADTGREALTDMHALLGVLRADGAAPATAPQPTLDDLPELVDRLRGSGQAVDLRVDGPAQPLDRAGHLAAYRLVQEALTNVVKHAGPDARAQVLLAWSPRLLRLRVTDTGTAPAGVPAADGRGLLGMTERVGLVGGRLRAGPGAAGGFVVEAEIPLDRAASGSGTRSEPGAGAS